MDVFSTTIICLLIPRSFDASIVRIPIVERYFIQAALICEFHNVIYCLLCRLYHNGMLDDIDFSSSYWVLLCDAKKTVMYSCVEHCLGPWTLDVPFERVHDRNKK